MLEASTPPVVSCILPVYNGERWLAAAINSVCRQTLGNIELIVVNDGSTDGSMDIIKSMQAVDPRIRIIDQPNQGIVSALNNALSVARGKYIARMDADDISVESRFQRQVDVLERRPDIAILGTRSRTIAADDQSDGSGEPVSFVGRIAEHRPRVGQFPPSVLQVLHPTIMMKTETLREMGGYRHGYDYAEDYDLYLRASALGCIAEIQDVLLLYRIHGGNVSIRRLEQQEESAARSDIDNVNDNRKHASLKPLCISPRTMRAWLLFRIYRRQRTLGVGKKRILLNALWNVVVGMTSTEIRISARIAGRCMWYYVA